MVEKTPSTSLRAINRLYKEAKELLETDPASAVHIAAEAWQRLRSRPLLSVFEQRRAADILLLLARSERRPTHNEIALRHAAEALRIFESIRALEEQAQTLHITGVLYWKKGEYTTAYEFLTRCLDILQEVDSPELKTSALMNLGMICWYLGDYEKALAYLEQSLAAYELKGNYRSMCTTLLNLGNVYSNNGDDARALEIYFRGISLIEIHIPDNKQEMAMLLMGVGSVFLRAGEYDRAFEYYLRGRAITEEIGDEAETATALLNIGLVLQENELPEAAISSITASLAIREKLQDTMSRAVCLVNLATVLSGLGRHEEAFVYAEQCIAICRASGDRRVLSYALHAAGQACLNLGNYDEALSRLLAGLAVCQEIHYTKGEIAINLELGLALESMGREQEGLEYLYQALFSAEKGIEKPLLLRVQKALASLCEKQGDIAEALRYYKQAYELNNTIFNEKSKRRMQVLQVAHHVAETRKEAEIYRLKTEQLEQKVEEQHREAVARTMHLTQHLDFLHRIKKILNSSLGAPQEDYRRGVRQVVSIVNSALNDETSWNSFEEQFQRVHPTFVETLRQHCPELSSVELRVCSLIRLNLSSKEVGRVLHIAPRSVDVYRYRIRKKLELGTEESLTAYLASVV